MDGSDATKTLWKLQGLWPFHDLDSFSRVRVARGTQDIKSPSPVLQTAITCRSDDVLAALLHHHLHKGVRAIQQPQAGNQLWHLGWLSRLDGDPHNGRGLHPVLTSQALFGFAVLSASLG